MNTGRNGRGQFQGVDWPQALTSLPPGRSIRRAGWDRRAGKPAEAGQSLVTAIADATKFGYVPGQLEGRVALGEIEMKSG